MRTDQFEKITFAARGQTNEICVIMENNRSSYMGPWRYLDSARDVVVIEHEEEVTAYVDINAIIAVEVFHGGQ
jgi:hypothetical protein